MHLDAGPRFHSDAIVGRVVQRLRREHALQGLTDGDFDLMIHMTLSEGGHGGVDADDKRIGRHAAVDIGSRIRCPPDGGHLGLPLPLPLPP